MNRKDLSRKDWVATNATISNVMLSDQGRGGSLYTVTFSYTVDGHYYGGEFVGSSGGHYKEGGSVSLKYNPANPDENDLSERGQSTLWLSWTIKIVGTAVLLYLICFRGCH